jgi:ferredoxin-NADP reductase
MLHALAAEGSARVVWWLFGARNSMEHPFAQESRDLLRALPQGRSYVQYSKPRPEDRIGIDFDASGHLTVPGLERLGVPLDADFYICGPTAFLRDTTNGLVAMGITGGRVHREVFGPGESTTPGVIDAFHPPPHQPAGPSGPGPSVSFGRSGITAQWGPAYQSLLELAEACDVPVRWSCRTGVCHTCESGLVSGAVRYAPEPLEPPAPGNVLICCSQPLDSVVIDL